jgi:hypothetical protein
MTEGGQGAVASAQKKIVIREFFCPNDKKIDFLFVLGYVAPKGGVTP